MVSVKKSVITPRGPPMKVMLPLYTSLEDLPTDLPCAFDDCGHRAINEMQKSKRIRQVEFLFISSSIVGSDSWDSAFRDRNRRLEAEGQLGFARDHRRVAARGKHQARPAGATRASADRRAFTAAGDGADRR